MRPPHHLHGVLDVTPFPCFLVLALALAGERILRGAGDRFGTVLFEHLPRNGVNSRLGNHVALPCRVMPTVAGLPSAGIVFQPLDRGSRSAASPIFVQRCAVLGR
jgi:hypothetical protein